MPKIVRPPINGAESYDIWDISRDRVINFLAEDERSLNFPVFSHYLCDESMRGKYWFKHVNYEYTAVEMNIGEGAISYQTANNVHVTGPGMIYLIAKGSTVKINHSGRDCRKLFLLVSGTCCETIAGALGLNSNRLITPAHPEKIENAMREIGTAIKTGEAPEHLSQLTYALLLALAADIKRTPDRITPALEKIIADPGAPLSIPELVRLCRTSSSSFHRHFLEYTGFTPKQYIIRQRLALGQELLVTGNMPIGEIALRCGFSDPVNFTVAFKKFYGTTPSQYRAENLRLT